MQNDLLKHELSFQGQIMSDWGAQHTLEGSLLGGMDMSMPSGIRESRPMPPSPLSFLIRLLILVNPPQATRMDRPTSESLRRPFETVSLPDFIRESRG